MPRDLGPACFSDCMKPNRIEKALCLMGLDTEFVHAGQDSVYPYDAITEPLILSTTFKRAPDGTYPFGYEYGRTATPNRTEFEKRMARLEEGASATAFASGIAAALAIFQVLRPGDHVVLADSTYFGVSEALLTHFSPWGVELSLVNAADIRAVEASMRAQTRIIFVETPSNPLLSVYDVERLTDIAHSHGAMLVCDNTLATPLFQKPLRLGADFVVHSTTKYISGNHDAQGGVIICREESEQWTAIRRLPELLGAVPSPFNCWLSSRGIPTLPCRLRQQSLSALRIASVLAEDSNVECVFYPGLPRSPSHELAARQMSGFGSVFSFTVRGGEAAAMRTAASVRLFQRATSFGGPESLIEHRASVEGSATRTPRNLLRVAVGLEEADDLLEDLVSALHSAP